MQVFTTEANDQRVLQRSVCVLRVGVELTGPEWNQLLGTIVIDPDGWDRRTLQWSTLRLDLDEFIERAQRSTADQVRLAQIKALLGRGE